ncbi:hypothetical protein KDJ05_gp55 [Arthrobacter phage Oxynfrius]|uniref:Uncharacterized protein n=1 Tax=Arthrobacter phage Oxynfrius TaxID=1897429 RepID=A0A1I9SE14_9CAUD|nr:hypothetical protein KDJ05_gp55 [Arthrobacter phage Oxynfrius]AOZ65091.1 hypothetical protein SEA_OXYNFRIUS_55 [Arthrobacter phage Oxynfrius]
MTETQNTTAKAVTTRHCTCGCGEATSSAKTMYKPGHDARHAGNVARAMAADYDDAKNADKLEALPTANLQHKAKMMAARLVAKEAQKTERAASRKPSDKPAKPAAKISEVVAAEEAAHAEEEAAKVPEPMFDEADKHIYTYGTVKIGRWEYPTRTSRQGFIGVKGVQTVTERNEKRDGSGKWIQTEA